MQWSGSRKYQKMVENVFSYITSLSRSTPNSNKNAYWFPKAQGDIFRLWKQKQKPYQTKQKELEFGESNMNQILKCLPLID